MMLNYGGRHYAAPVHKAPALEILDLTLHYPGNPQPVVHNFTLTIHAGERVALIGDNGAGKSTLIKAVAGLLKPNQGQIRIYGLPVGGCHHRTAYLPQRGQIDWRFPISLRELVLTGRYVHLGWLRRPSNEDKQIADAMLEKMGLADLAKRQISELSGGQQQRAMLARALTQDADLLLLDEPLTAVDASTRVIISSVLDELKQRGKTCVIATHHLENLEEEFDRVVHMSYRVETMINVMANYVPNTAKM
jgi:ABC-type Mn2+/Zn2+ transport system ATPase subunit